MEGPQTAELAMSSTATQTQEAHEPAAAEASHKRNCEESKDDADEKAVVRKYGLDRDIINCPICMKPFSGRVYQCQNGHTICGDCCTNLDNWYKCLSCPLPTGATYGIRCFAIERLVESLSVSCKYARHGCEQMQRPSGIENHERYCKCKPFCCPVPECDYKASRDFLRRHLFDSHQMKAAAVYNNDTGVTFNTGVTFGMGPSKFELVIKGWDIQGEPHEVYLIHRRVHENLSDIYFCTHFGDFDIVDYNLRVTPRFSDQVTHSMENARAIKLQYLESVDFRQEDFLVVPPKDCRPSQSFEVHFKLTDCRDYDD